jgi:hypothetical protein
MQNVSEAGFECLKELKKGFDILRKSEINVRNHLGGLTDDKRFLSVWM